MKEHRRAAPFRPANLPVHTKKSRQLRDLAMTGEVTLRGRALPIGGLQEKILAAKMAGITEVLVPVENKKDIEEIPEEIREGLVITYVKDMKEVFKRALL